MMKLKKLYRNMGLSYIMGQVIIFLILLILNSKKELSTISIEPIHLIYPFISLLLLIINLFLFKVLISKLHPISFLWFWTALFVPLIIPAFLHNYNIFYSLWIFILCTSTIGAVLFYDKCLLNGMVKNINIEGHRVLYNELKYYLDKLATAWLTLGSVFTVIATILWTASSDIMNISLYERTNINLFMLFSFALETLLIGIFVGIPIVNRMNISRDILIRNKAANKT